MARVGWGIWTGLALTALAVVLHAVGTFERLELIAYDYNVRHFSRIPASDRILHIDIDDDALDRVGSWPWPRDLQADLIRILHELGAARIAVDIVWAEPKAPDVRVPSLDRYSDIEGEVEHMGEVSAENVILQDDELARAIEESQSVYLSMYYNDQSAAWTTTALGTRIAELLRQNFGLTVDEIAAELKEERSAVEDVLAGIKRHVAQEHVARFLKSHPDASFPEVHAEVLKTPLDRFTADRADVLAAYQRELSLRALRQQCPPVPAGLKGRIPILRDIVPPVYKFTSGARRTGFVTFKPDDIDGRTRHVPLVAEWDGRLIMQLGFAVACDELDVRPEDLSIEKDRLRIAARGRRGPLAVQIDERQSMLINWHVAPGWQRCFGHIPAAQLLRITDARRKLRDNELRRTTVIAQAMRLAKDDAAYEGYREQVNEWIRLRRQARWGELAGRREAADVREVRARAEQLGRTIESDQKETAAFIDEQWKALQAEQNPQDPQIAAEIKRFGEAHRLLHDVVGEIELANAAIGQEQAQWTERLRPVVQDKLCFLGYTATAVADMITTPAYPRVPGVIVHSSVLNSFLEGRFRRWSPGWLQALVIAVLGMFVTVTTATRGPKVTAVVVLAVIALTWGLNATAVFYRLDTWLRLLTALGLMLVVWAVIVLLRFLITDRQRRQFSRAVAQYVSPAMARRIADSAEQLNLAPASGEVTCFFSDLAGFTQASERLGPEGTREVLNPYLEAMSNVLHRHNALINKFMGDGVFAFFNPPILPCPEHERAACEAALDSLEALRELAARHSAHPLAAEFKRLYMRIGIASGRVFVGDYGSENKLDYTCMGDTVNLASRLEGANKFFGSTIMVSGATRDAVGDAFVFRRLGRLQVKGQTVAVRVYELLGRTGQVNGDILAFTSAFEHGVEAFARRNWDESAARFRSCLELRSNEPGALRYLSAIEHYRQSPPPQDWNMGIELTEK